MKVKDCLEILRDIKDVAFATVDEKGHPQNRIIDVMLVEEEKLYFCVARGKDFYLQLMKNNYVAITGLNKEFKMVRLNGEVKRLDKQKLWINRIFEENPVMNDVYPSDSRYILEAFCIEKGQLEFFDLGKSPIYRESFSMGSFSEEKKGFIINNSCIGCEKCAKICPQKCIESGSTYKIIQNNCLHCGLCFENCPVNSIERIVENLS